MWPPESDEARSITAVCPLMASTETSQLRAGGLTPVDITTSGTPQPGAPIEDVGELPESFRAAHPQIGRLGCRGRRGRCGGRTGTRRTGAGLAERGGQLAVGDVRREHSGRSCWAA